MKTKSITNTFLFLLLSIFAGCVHLRDGLPQEVVVMSYPSGAEVIINGEAYGKTPLVTNLPRKLTHEVRIEKTGYNSAVKYFTPVPNSKSENFIKFGLSRDLGHYVDLEPQKMEEELESDLVPASKGTQPFKSMAESALKADAKLEAGEMSPEEHKIVIEQIVGFFEEKKAEPIQNAVELVAEPVAEQPENALFDQMAKEALEADRRLEAGEISPEEHKALIEAILQSFEEQI